MVIYFVAKSAELLRCFKSLKQIPPKDGAVWIGWPKRASAVETDLNENVIREVGLNHGLVDVKVISINEQWSALKFVYRLKDRRLR